MWIFYQIIMLFCVVSFLKAQSPSPTKNPECGGMSTASKHMETGLKALPSISQAHCKPNKHCTGVSCYWSGDGSLEVDLHHCTKPVSYHVLFKYPGFANENITLHEGDDKSLYDKNHATAKIKVTKLERSENIITTSVVLETCFYGPITCRQHPLITQQKFCVKMENCPGFNASLHHYKPCGSRPTGSPYQSPPYRSPSPGSPYQSPPHRSPSAGHFKTHSASQQRISSDTFKTPSPWQSSSTDPLPEGHAHPHKADDKDDSSRSLSTAAIVGISAAGVVAVLVVVAASVYWKKYHYRSRLRAAYYNEISMHDPLYEDFGPEVA